MKKSAFLFKLFVDIDEHTGQIIAVYFGIRQGKSHRVKEFEDGAVFADYGRNGELLGIELLAPCRSETLTRIVKGAPEKRFVRASVPNGMLVPA